MSWTGSWNAAVAKAKAAWDPAKHPRGRDGKFIEVGDLVAIFSGPNSGQIDSGTVVAGHLASDGRFYVGVKSVTSGKVAWYRPKQVEQVNPKATLTPKMPVPALDGMPDEAPWTPAQVTTFAPQVAAKKGWSGVDPETGHTIAIDHFGNLTDYGAPVAPTAPAAVDGEMPTPKPGAKVYSHFMGAKIYVNPDGSMEAYGKNGKKKKTTATPEKLAEGYGQWKLESGGVGGNEILTVPPAPASAPADDEAGILPPAVLEALNQGDLQDSAFALELENAYGQSSLYVSKKSGIPGGSPPPMLSIEYEDEEGIGHASLYDATTGNDIGAKYDPNAWIGGPGWEQWIDFEAAEADAAGPAEAEFPGQLGVSVKTGLGVAGVAAGKEANSGYYYAHVPTGDNPDQVVQFSSEGAFITTLDVVGWSGLTAVPNQFEVVWTDPAFAAEQNEPAPVTGDPAKVELVVKGVITSASNKAKAGTIPEGHVTKIVDAVNAAIKDPNEESAQKYLAVAMTLAKLGGKQRARYKQLLAEGRGIAVSQVAPGTVDPNPTGNHYTPIVAKLAPGQKAMSLTNANQWVQSGGKNGPAAKSRVQAALLARLGDVDTEEFAKVLSGSPGMNSGGNDMQAKLAEEWRRYKKEGGPVQVKVWTSSGSSGAVPLNSTGYMQATVPDGQALEAMVRATAVNAMIQTWAGTSNDNNPRSLSMQDAAAEEFGLDPSWIYNWHSKPASFDAHYKAHSATYRRFVRAMYDNTQAELKKLGVTHIRLRRGSSTLSNIAGNTVYAGGKVNVKFRPLSSFTSNTGTANGFSHGGRVVDAYVPIERIMGSAATGFGCWGEYEFVVLGGPNEVEVIK